VRLDRLRRGYRFIDLTDCMGNPTDGKLFVRVDKVLKQPTMGLVRGKTMKLWQSVKASTR
jgi:hypothetical protein